MQNCDIVQLKLKKEKVKLAHKKSKNSTKFESTKQLFLIKVVNVIKQEIMNYSIRGRFLKLVWALRRTNRALCQTFEKLYWLKSSAQGAKDRCRVENC